MCSSVHWLHSLQINSILCIWGLLHKVVVRSGYVQGNSGHDGPRVAYFLCWFRCRVGTLLCRMSFWIRQSLGINRSKVAIEPNLYWNESSVSTSNGRNFVLLQPYRARQKEHKPVQLVARLIHSRWRFRVYKLLFSFSIGSHQELVTGRDQRCGQFNIWASQIHLQDVGDLGVLAWLHSGWWISVFTQWRLNDSHAKGVEEAHTVWDERLSRELDFKWHLT